MGFKIGDRVRFKPEYSHPGHGVGTVTAVGGLGDVDPRAEIAFDGVDDKGEWMMWALELAGPVIRRGPKPLTLTGGTVRMTVRNGWTTRKDMHNWMHGRRLRESGWYR